MIMVFFTKCYCYRTIGCCFPYCFLEIFIRGQDLHVGDKAVMGRLLFSYCFLESFVGWDKTLMEGDKVVMGDPPGPPTKENPAG